MSCRCAIAPVSMAEEPRETRTTRGMPGSVLQAGALPTPCINTHCASAQLCVDIDCTHYAVPRHPQHHTYRFECSSDVTNARIKHSYHSTDHVPCMIAPGGVCKPVNVFLRCLKGPVRRNYNHHHSIGLGRWGGNARIN